MSNINLNCKVLAIEELMMVASPCAKEMSCCLPTQRYSGL